MDRIESTTASGFPPNINRYFLRATALDIVGNSKGTFVYTKFPKFILLGVISSGEISKMRSSRVALKQGRILPQRYQWPDGLAEYIMDKAKYVAEIYKRIPQQHLDSFEDYIHKNPDKAGNSKLFEAFMHDYEMFGDGVFR